MQQRPQEPEMTVDEALEIYNNYLRTLKDELNVNDYLPEYLPVIKDITHAQITMADMQRQDVTLEWFLQTMRPKIKSICIKSPPELVSPSFPPYATSEELYSHLSFYQLQGYNIEDVIDGVYDTLLCDVDSDTFDKLIMQFSEMIASHPIFQANKDAAEVLQKHLNELADLKDIYTMFETEIQSANVLLDKLPGKAKDKQLSKLKSLCNHINDIDDAEVAKHCASLMRGVQATLSLNKAQQQKYIQLTSAEKLNFIRGRKEFRILRPKDKLYITHVGRVLNIIDSFASMKRQVDQLHKGLKAREELFQGKLQAMTDKDSGYSPSDWELMERVLLNRDQDEVYAALQQLSLPELKLLRKSFEHPTVIAMIDRVPEMKQHRAEKFMRKRKVIMGYDLGGQKQQNAEDRSLKSKTEKGKYRDKNHGKNLRRP